MPETGVIEEWRVASFSIKNRAGAKLTASALDMTNYATVAPFEDHMVTGPHSGAASVPGTPVPPTSRVSSPVGALACSLWVQIRAVYILWNVREAGSGGDVTPVRVVQTDSPKISCLALSSLYIVHGGSDGLVQIWDPLASTLEPVRTLSAEIIRSDPTSHREREPCSATRRLQCRRCHLPRSRCNCSAWSCCLWRFPPVLDLQLNTPALGSQTPSPSL